MQSNPLVLLTGATGTSEGVFSRPSKTPVCEFVVWLDAPNFCSRGSPRALKL